MRQFFFRFMIKLYIILLLPIMQKISNINEKRFSINILIINNFLYNIGEAKFVKTNLN